MKMTNQEYRELVEKKSPNSKLPFNMVKAFFVGGSICTIGQGLKNMYLYFGLPAEDAGCATSITLIFFGALLTGLNIYDNIAKFAGAGTVVPITGFANAIVSPAMEFKSEGIVLGMSAKLFSIAGPVIVFGISASIIYGLILLIIH